MYRCARIRCVQTRMMISFSLLSRTYSNAEAKEMVRKWAAKLRNGSDRGLNKKQENRQLVLVAAPLAAVNGCGRTIQFTRTEELEEIKDRLQELPLLPMHADLPAKTSFVYTNVKAVDGGQEG